MGAVQSSKLEVSVTGIWSWLTFGTFVSGCLRLDPHPCWWGDADLWWTSGAPATKGTLSPWYPEPVCPRHNCLRPFFSYTGPGSLELIIASRWNLLLWVCNFLPLLAQQHWFPCRWPEFPPNYPPVGWEILVIFHSATSPAHSGFIEISLPPSHRSPHPHSPQARCFFLLFCCSAVLSFVSTCTPPSHSNCGCHQLDWCVFKYWLEHYLPVLLILIWNNT